MRLSCFRLGQFSGYIYFLCRIHCNAHPCSLSRHTHIIWLFRHVSSVCTFFLLCKHDGPLTSQVHSVRALALENLEGGEKPPAHVPLRHGFHMGTLGFRVSMSPDPVALIVSRARSIDEPILLWSIVVFRHIRKGSASGIRSLYVKRFLVSVSLKIPNIISDLGQGSRNGDLFSQCRPMCSVAEIHFFCPAP